jgi:hypothetical protein
MSRESVDAGSKKREGHIDMSERPGDLEEMRKTTFETNSYLGVEVV